MKQALILLSILTLLLPACNVGGTAKLPDGTSAATPTAASPTPTGASPPTATARPSPTAVTHVGAEPGPEPDSYWVTNPTGGARLYVRVIHPKNWDGRALPTLVLVPGGSSDSSGFLKPPSQAQRLADAGLTIVVFDPDGRGRSEGKEDYDGYTHQDGLAAIIRFVATLPEVDASQIGLVSYSYGITMAAGALARYPDLPVLFLIDWEGPADRNDTGGCDAAHTGHLKKYPCDDEAFWREREAATFALHLSVPYQRLQSERDHVQPDNNHALLMIANATAKEYGGHGIAPWTRLNSLEPNTVYDTANPPPMLSERDSKRLEPLIVRYALELFDLFAPAGEAGQATLPPPTQAESLLTVDAAPGGETLRPLLGVNVGPIPGGTDPNNADVTAQYQAIGVTMIRTHGYSGPLDMSVIYPDQNADPTDPASYHFERSDRVFRAILDGGFEPYLRLGDSWNTPGLEQRAPTNPQNWVRAAVEVVRHYRQMAAEAGIPLRYVEIWNEPNSKQFWDSTPQAFFDLFAQTAQALKAEFPDLKVGGPGLTQGAVMLPQGQQYTENFLAYLQDHGVPLDFLSWHLYSGNPDDYRQAARFYREQLDAHGYTEAESHITEWNTAAENGELRVSDVSLRAGGKGASLLSAAWIVLQEEGVDVSTIFRGTDTSIDVPSFYGIFYADGRPKHPALAFSLWARMAAHPRRLNVSHGDDGLWVLAGQDDGGEIALLIVNPTETPTSWRAEFTHRDLVQGATLYQVSDAAETVQAFSLETPAAEIGAYTVQLLIAAAVTPPPAAVTPPPAAATAQPPPASTAGAAIIPIGGVGPAHPHVRPLLGVISGPIQPLESPIRDLSDHLRDIGVVTIRNNDYFDDRMDIEGIFNCGGPTYPSWEGCDPQDEANYNWESSDELFESWLSGGFEPFLRLGGEVQNAARHHDFKGPQNATQEANWIVAAQKVVGRYLYWGGNEQTFTYLDIWTEFPNKFFWDRSNIAFFRFWTKAFVALKSAYPQLKIGGPGFIAGQTVRVAAGDGGAVQAFLTYLYENGVKPDWIGWHLFYNDPLMWYRAAQAYRDLLDGEGLYADVPWAGSGFFNDVELIVDAYGVAKMNLSPEERDRIYNHQKGAALRTASWIAMQYSDVERAYLYRAGDPHSTPNDSPVEVYRGTYSGLFYGDAQGTYKPAAHAFRLWSRVVSEYPTLLTTPLPPTAESGGLWVLAARNDQAEIAVLVANVTADDVAWSLTFDDGTTLADYRLTLYQVDDVHDGRTPLPWSGGALTIPAESVQLIVLEPEG